MFLLSAKVSLCLDNKADCILTVELLTDILLPKPLCNLETKFTLPNISASDFLKNQVVDTVLNLDAMPEFVSDLFIEATGVKQYMEDPSCSRSSAPYAPSTDGWSKECIGGLGNLTALTPLSLATPKGHIASRYVEKKFNLKGVVKLTYTITNLQSAGKYQLDMKMEICFNSSVSCDFEMTVFSGTQLPKQYCFTGSTFTDPGCQTAPTLTTLPGSGIVCNLGDSCTKIDCCVDIAKLDTTFRVYADLDVCSKEFTVGVENFNRTISLYSFQYAQEDTFSFGGLVNIKYKAEELTAEKVYLLYMTISICFETVGDCRYSYTVFDGVKIPKQPCDWTGGYAIPECTEAPVTLLQMDQSVISCNLESTCRGLSCALDVPFISKTFEFYMRLEQCDYMLKVGIERQQYERTLKGYQWGEWTHVDLNGVLKMSFVLHDLYAEPAFLISMKLSLCWEANQPCGTVYNIFDKVRLPKKVCDWDKKFLQNEFSLSEYLDEKSVPTNTIPLDIHTIAQLLHDTALAPYMMDDACDQTVIPYYPNDKGWNRGLATWLTDNSVTKTEPLRGSETSKLMSDAGIASYLYEPSCDQQGSTYSGNVGGVKNDCNDTDVVAISTNPITCRLKSDCAAVSCCLDEDFISKTFEVLFEIDDCERKIYIGIEKLKFYIPLHDFEFDVRCCVSVPILRNHTFDFSLNLDGCTQYMEITLENYKEQFMLRDFTFGQENYLWIKGVLRLKYTIDDLPAQNLYRVSVMFEVCTTNGSPCEYSLTVMDSVELPRSSCLPEWGYGYAEVEKSYELDLGGIYRVSFSVDDLMSSGMYVVNMTVSICWSSGQDCQFVSQVFQNTLLPKHTCDTQTDFAQSGDLWQVWLIGIVRIE
ncbi:unnamed protein product [Mytilus edulis]|uniref:Uncharacterized protein n=1 Tax=Mytilus edulis TaxID=6550 RepID=A0A8S3V0Z8_MYTED|nr:unnamed protein product [Mytilus edulis]